MKAEVVASGPDLRSRAVDRVTDLRLAAVFSLAAAAVRIVLAAPQQQPGYMDAAYYFDIAANLAEGRGFTEDFAWNYLTHPTSLPQPSNAHWMPLTSIVVAPFLMLFGVSYRAAQIPLVILAVLLVPLTYLISNRAFQRRDWAATSAVLMLASSFYVPYWAAVDGFGLYAVVGTILLVNISRPGRQNGRAYFVSGLLVGLGHLTRADGFLLAIPLLTAWARARRNLFWLSNAFAAYLMVMIPWFIRNQQEFGAPLVGGSVLFMRDYNDLFLYETPLTLETWVASGWVSIVVAKLRALILNLATVAGALHFVFLPLTAVAMWRERSRPIVLAAGVYVISLVLAMSFLFSQPGPRGTFFHSLSAALPLLYVMAPAGLSYCTCAVANRRPSWNARQAEGVFTLAFLLLAMTLSVYFYLTNMMGSGSQPGWNDRHLAYRSVDTFLRREMGDSTSPVMSINPPAYFYFNERPSIAIPTDGESALVHAAHQFGAKYFVLEADHPPYLAALYQSSGTDPRFIRQATFGDQPDRQTHLYEILSQR